MIDIASIVLGGFQDDLVNVFGSSFGWLIGHLIILGTLALATLAVANRDHILNRSGINRGMALDVVAFFILSAILFWVFTGSFGFSSGPSAWLAAASSLSIGWAIKVLG
ncbi:MAG: hypothetical protein QF911_01345 [Candidatus Thalassarchaeaceae archaeon]|nr:hypothetical protein [Candidatus Thalassarchaeaceae archaeon]